MEYLIKIKDIFLKSPMKAIAVMLLIIASVLFMFNDKRETVFEQKDIIGTAYIFVQDNCIYCHKELLFINAIKERYPRIKFEVFNMKDEKTIGILLREAAKAKLDIKNVGTPIFIFKDQYVLGYASDMTTGEEIMRAIKKYY